MDTHGREISQVILTLVLKWYLNLGYSFLTEACKSDDESIPMHSTATNGDSANDKAVYSDKLHFECHVCQKSYDTKYLLQCHMLTHKGKKPYTCVICDEKTFTNCEELRNHLALHFKEEGVLCYY